MKQRILVIDDEECIRLTFESFLSDAGFDTHAGASFSDAMSLLSANTYDLVIADVLLGDGNGIDILRAIRMNGKTCPVIIMTSSPNIETESAAKHLGAMQYMTKPIRQSVLLDMTNRLLQNMCAPDDQFCANKGIT